MNFYPFHIGDYASATRHLSWIEDAAYRRLLDVYYVKEEPLPLDVRQVYRLVVASTDEQREAVDVVLGEFFICMEDGYHHTRCDAEIFKVAREQAMANAGSARRRAVKRRATPSWLSNEHKMEIAAIYDLAAFLSRTTGVEYHVDHIFPLSGKTVCGLHVPLNLRVITAADNLKKHAKLEAE